MIRRRPWVVVLVVVVVIVIVIMMVLVRMALMGVAVCMGVAMTSMGVPVVSMVKRHDTDEVDHQSETADGQQLTKSLHLVAFYQPLDSFIDDLNADKPAQIVNPNAD